MLDTMENATEVEREEFSNGYEVWSQSLNEDYAYNAWAEELAELAQMNQER
jgi:hypothetical protein